MIDFVWYLSPLHDVLTQNDVAVCWYFSPLPAPPHCNREGSLLRHFDVCEVQ